MGSKKKDADSDPKDDQSITSDGRPEGNNAELFAQATDNMEFSPSHPQPPAYIKVRAKYKKKLDFDRTFLAQELRCGLQPRLQRQDSTNKLRRKSTSPPDDSNTVWTMEFSRDGRYLAAGGADKIVRIWAVLSSAEDRQKHEAQESNQCEAGGPDVHAEHLSAPVFQGEPIREYQGHTATILDLSWSKNNFLLTSSMDRTVRLWHVSRTECLCTFKHNDFVPSISFHPKDDRFFLAGSLDSKLRLWSIPDKSVAFTAQLPDLITAVEFTPDGKYAMAGCLSGVCMFYETENLKYHTQIQVRSTRGPNAKGSKITGIRSQYDASGDIKILITSNDSRIRIYNFRDKSLELKFRGNANSCSQIRAAFSDDGRYVVCGSEDRKAYVWSVQHAHGEKRDKTPMEMFEAHDTITTVVCLAPTKTRHHLSRSGDPIYDLCNPPAITLFSGARRPASLASTTPPTENGSSVRGATAEMDVRAGQPKETPAYLARSAHKNGNILVTADFSGRIKVFRQDCAWSKRKTDDADRSSLFTRRSDKLSRTASLATRGSQRSLKEGRNSPSLQAPSSDRILSWRQGISSTSSITDDRSSKNTSRSISPRKSLDRRSKTDIKPTESNGTKASHPLATDVMVRTPSSEVNGRVLSLDENARSPTADPQPLHTRENPLSIEEGRSYLFWNLEEWGHRKDDMQRTHEAQSYQSHSPQENGGSSGGGGGDEHGPDHLTVRPAVSSTPSYVSELSDERSSIDVFDDAREQGDEEMKCSHCGSKSFSARKEKTSTQLVCTNCGYPQT